jgi:hypothetical protein
MSTIRGLAHPTLQTPQTGADATWQVPRVGLVLALLAVLGLGLALLQQVVPAPTAPVAVPVEPAAPGPPVGDIPILGDPVRDLTVWYSDRVRDANHAALDNLKGQLLTPIDPLADTVTRTLYGPMVLITIPLLTFGGLILGYLIMVSRTSGETAYAAHSVAPRFVVGATLAILGIFLVSVITQFVAALDAAMVGVALPASAVGGPADWPSTGGVFLVLQQGGFDPRVAQGPDNWNSGSWLSSGLLAGILTTCLAMLNWLLSGVERLIVLAGPLCLAAYAIPAAEGVTRLWFKVLIVVLAVRFAWAITFVLFSLTAAPHLGAAGAPASVQDTNVLLGLAAGAAAMMLGLPLALIPIALAGPQILDVQGAGRLVAALRYL